MTLQARALTQHVGADITRPRARIEPTSRRLLHRAALVGIEAAA